MSQGKFRVTRSYSKIAFVSRVVAVAGSRFRRDDLLGFSVHCTMEFTPNSAFSLSEFLNIPFALAVNLQTNSTVEHIVKKAALVVQMFNDLERLQKDV